MLKVNFTRCSEIAIEYNKFWNSNREFKYFSIIISYELLTITATQQLNNQLDVAYNKHKLRIAFLSYTFRIAN